MKIGLLTQTTIYNYGSILQAYALVRKLESLGCDVKVVNYWPRDFYDSFNRVYLPYNLGFFGNLKRAARNFLVMLHSKSIRRSRARYSEFRSRWFNFTKPCFSESDIIENASDCDIFIVGSDCLWNPDCGIFPVYFLNFTRKIGKPSIAYGPSLSVTKMPNPEAAKEMSELLKCVDFLSSRESAGSRIVEKLSGRSCETVLDPTLLFDSDFWLKLVPNPKIEGDYTFVYAIHMNEGFSKLVAEARKSGREKIVLVASSMSIAYSIGADVKILDAGPLEFLGLLFHAKKVLISSFHGIAFSVIFKKNFAAYVSKADDSRMGEFLKNCGLGDRLVKSYEEYSKLGVPDFSKCEAYLKSARAKSESYLRRSMETCRSKDVDAVL